MTNKGLEDFLLKKNINLTRTNVGDRNIRSEMKSKNLVLGGEPSGHIILNNYSSTGDGILASLEVLGIMKSRKKKLSALSDVYKPYPQIIHNYSLRANTKAEILIKKVNNKLNKKIKKYKARVVIRKSGTENKIRIMAEAKDIKTTKNIFEESVRLLKEEKIW